MPRLQAGQRIQTRLPIHRTTHAEQQHPTAQARGCSRLMAYTLRVGGQAASRWLECVEAKGANTWPALHACAWSAARPHQSCEQRGLPLRSGIRRACNPTIGEVVPQGHQLWPHPPLEHVRFSGRQPELTLEHVLLWADNPSLPLSTYCCGPSEKLRPSILNVTCGRLATLSHSSILGPRSTSPLSCSQSSPAPSTIWKQAAQGVLTNACTQGMHMPKCTT
eukprot:365606-Chlamydomonas_euryale.AAC.5